MYESCIQLLTFLNSARLRTPSVPCRNLSTHIGASTATRAALTLLSVICFDVLPNVHPPQLKPINTVTSAPAQAPCSNRVTDSPSKILGNCMVHPFARHRSERGNGIRMGSD